MGVALNGFYWRVINILQSVIGPEPRDHVGTMITAHIAIKTDRLPSHQSLCPENGLIIISFKALNVGAF